MTSAIIVMVLVAMMYSQNYLNGQLAQDEFATNKQFMLTTGLQVDDVAWSVGRAQTIRYSCKYSGVQFEPQVMTYSIHVIYQDNTQETINDSLQTGAILFNMPTSAYTLGSNYFQPVYPSQISFLQEGPAASVSQVYIKEKLPMSAGNYTRIVAVPSIRMINSQIGNQTYVRFFLPLLTSGSSPYLSQSVTLIGNAVTHYIRSNVAQIKLSVSFPKSNEGFDHNFFPLGTADQYSSLTTSYQQTVPLAPSTLPPNSVVEFYIGQVTVSLGAYI